MTLPTHQLLLRGFSQSIAITKPTERLWAKEDF